MMSTGTQITDMTVTAPPLPALTYVPIAVTDPTTGLSPVVSYRYDLGTDLLTRVSYAALLASGGAGLVGFIQAGTGAGLQTVQGKLRQTISVEDFYNGTTDAATAINRALTRIVLLGGGTVNFTAPSYALTSQVTLDRAGLSECNIILRGNGAVLTTSGAISAIEVSGGAATTYTTIEGFVVDQQGNASATGAFDLSGAPHVTFRDTLVVADGDVAGTYKAVRVRQSTLSDDNTGSFWAKFDNFGVRGTSVAKIPCGVSLEGAANDTDLTGYWFSNVTDGVQITYPVGYHNLCNHIDCSGMDGESFVNAVRVIGESTHQTVYGLIMDRGRYETGTYLLSLEGATLDTQMPPFIGRPDFLQSVSGRVNNPNSLIVSIDDGYIGSTSVSSIIYRDKGITFANEDAAYDAFTVMAQEGKGQAWAVPSGIVATARFAGGTSTTLFEIAANAGVTLGVSGLKGLSQSSASSYNIAGVSGALSGGHIDVAFGVNQPSANYRVPGLTPNAAIAGRLSVSNKATTGFRINSTDAGDTATVDWFLIQD